MYVPMKLRVIQWATGPVGRHAATAVLEHPDLELVGALVYDPNKAGRDVGELIGGASTGVFTTSDREQILELPADCALYMAQGEMNPPVVVDDVCRLLAAGKNVVSTALTSLIYPAAAGSKVVERLEAACEEGGTSFHATGIEPGWASEVLPLTMSGVFRHIDHLLVQELLDYASYDNAEMLFDIMGFGRPPDAAVPMSSPEIAGMTFHAPIMLVADGLGARIDRFSYDRQVALADRAFDVAAGRIEVGTVSAQRFSCSAIINGRKALAVEHITRLADDQAPDWPTGRGWKVTVQGRPSMVLEATIAVHGEDENDQGCLATAMHAVHAIAPVCAAAPGIRTFLDLPLLKGRHVFGAADGAQS